VEIKIGIQNAPRELAFETAQAADEVTALVSAALTDGSVLSLSDDKGRLIMVPGDRIAFVEIGTQEGRRIGFAT